MTGLATCPYCETEFPAGLASCPRCGAGTDVRTSVDDGGWSESPPMRDMAEIQFGRSHAQIEGLVVPVVDTDLAAGDVVYCTHDKLLWTDRRIKLSTMPGDVFPSERSGRPLTLIQAEGPGRIAFSDNHPGELVAMPLEADSVLIARQHHMLLATGNVQYDGSFVRIWYDALPPHSSEPEREHPAGFFERFMTLDYGPGLVILHAAGNVFTRTLAAGEHVDVAPHAALAWMGRRGIPQGAAQGAKRTRWQGGLRHGMSVYQQTFPSPVRHRGHVYTHNHHLAVRLIGPGTVWIQSGGMGRTEEHREVGQYSTPSVAFGI